MNSFLEEYIDKHDKEGTIVALMCAKIFEPGTGLSLLYGKYDLERNKELMLKIFREIITTCTNLEEDKHFFCGALTLLLFNLKGDLYELAINSQKQEYQLLDYIEQVKNLTESSNSKDKQIKKNTDKYFLQVKEWVNKVKENCDRIKLLEEKLNFANLENSKLKDTISQLSLKNIYSEDQLDKTNSKIKSVNNELSIFKKKITKLEKDLEISSALLESKNTKISDLEKSIKEKNKLLETKIVETSQVKLLYEKLNISSTTIESLEKNNGEKDKIIEKFKSTLDKKQKLLDESSIKLKEKDKLLEEFKSNLDKKEKLIGESNLKLLEDLKSKLDKKQKLLDESNLKLQEKDKLLDDIKVNMVQLADHTELKKKLDLANQQILELEELLKSNSDKLLNEQLSENSSNDEKPIYTKNTKKKNRNKQNNNYCYQQQFPIYYQVPPNFIPYFVQNPY